jgi:rhodanese-related sulfurtransferase
VRDAFFWLAVLALAALFIPRFLGLKHRIGGVEARKKVEDGALLLDVRTPAEFAGGHLPGAKNVPVGELSARLGELPKDRAIVAYCQSGMRSASAVRLLRAQGFEAWNLGGMGAYDRG